MGDMKSIDSSLFLSETLEQFNAHTHLHVQYKIGSVYL